MNIEYKNFSLSIFCRQMMTRKKKTMKMMKMTTKSYLKIPKNMMMILKKTLTTYLMNLNASGLNNYPKMKVLKPEPTVKTVC